MNIETILNNDEYLFQYISDGNDKLLVYIKAAPDENDKLDTEKHSLDANKVDIYAKAVLKCGYDVVYIRSKNIDNMYDSICNDSFNAIQTITQTYSIVDGWFVCGGSVLGLYFSKLINYRNIFCVSSRFIQRMTMDRALDFKYTNYKVVPECLNQNAKYYIVYNKNQINMYDKNTAKWLRLNTANNLTYVYDNSESYDKHLLEQQVYLKTYLKEFIPNMLNENILNITGMTHEISN